MTRARRRLGAPQVLGGLVALGAAILVVKWLLITAAILAVPFGIWFLYDRSRTPVPPRVDPVTAPINVVRSTAPRRPDPTRAVPTPLAPVRRPMLAGDREVVVTREEDHQDVLARHHRGGPPTRVTAELHPGTVTRGKHRGSYAIEVRLDGARVGELTAAMSTRYRPLVDREGHARAEGHVSRGARGLQLDLRLPAMS